MASVLSPAASYLLALTVADVVFSTAQCTMLIVHNIPIWNGFPIDIVLSDLSMIPFEIIVQWPIILALSILPFLAALFIQRKISESSKVFFLVMGIVIAALSAGAMYLLYFRNMSDDPDGPDPLYYATHTGLIAMLSGGVGALVYRVKTLPGSNSREVAEQVSGLMAGEFVQPRKSKR